MTDHRFVAVCAKQLLQVTLALECDCERCRATIAAARALVAKYRGVA